MGQADWAFILDLRQRPECFNGRTSSLGLGSGYIYIYSSVRVLNEGNVIRDTLRFEHAHNKTQVVTLSVGVVNSSVVMAGKKWVFLTSSLDIYSL